MTTFNANRGSVRLPKAIYYLLLLSSSGVEVIPRVSIIASATSSVDFYAMQRSKCKITSLIYADIPKTVPATTTTFNAAQAIETSTTATPKTSAPINTATSNIEVTFDMLQSKCDIYRKFVLQTCCFSDMSMRYRKRVRHDDSCKLCRNVNSTLQLKNDIMEYPIG